MTGPSATTRAWTWSILVILSLLLLSPGLAFAYVRTTNSHGVPISWNESCVFLTPDTAGCPDVGPESTLQAVEASVESWNQAADGCSATIRFMLTAPKEGLCAGFDDQGKNENVIVWRTDHWGNDQIDYDPQALALTTLTYVSDEGNDQDGRILDADIEFNGVTRHFTTDPSANPNSYDIQNDLTHELGHVLGLDHTCYDGWFDERPKDDQGNPIPDCSPASLLPDSIRQATMYPYSQPDETDKRSLEQDDIDGICGIYPSDRKAGACQAVDLTPKGCGCRSTKPDASWWPFLLLLGIWLGKKGRLAVIGSTFDKKEKQKKHGQIGKTSQGG